MLPSHRENPLLSLLWFSSATAWTSFFMLGCLSFVMLPLSEVHYRIITPGCFFPLVLKINEMMLNLLGGKTKLSGSRVHLCVCYVPSLLQNHARKKKEKKKRGRMEEWLAEFCLIVLIRKIDILIIFWAIQKGGNWLDFAMCPVFGLSDPSLFCTRLKYVSNWLCSFSVAPWPQSQSRLFQPWQKSVQSLPTTSCSPEKSSRSSEAPLPARSLWVPGAFPGNQIFSLRRWRKF